MSDTTQVLLIDGKPIGYFPPTSAENVTYEEGVSVKDALDTLDSTVTFSPTSGQSVASISASQTGRLVAGTCRMALTASAGAETNIAMVDKKPTENVYCLAFNTGNMAVGRVVIYTSGSVTCQFSSALNASGVSFEFAYKTND